MKFNPGSKHRIQDVVCDSRFHPKGEVFALGTFTSRVEIYRSGSKISDLENHHNESSIRKIRFDSTGKLLTAARIVRIYDLQSQASSKLKLSNGSEGGKDKIYSLATFGANMVCAGTDGGSFQVWDTRKGREPVFATHENQGYISDITGSIRKHLFLTSGDGYVTGYDMRKLKWMDEEPILFDTGFHCIKLSQDKKLVVGTESGSLYIFDRRDFGTLDSKMALADDPGNRGEKGINAIERLADEQTFVSACADGKLRFFSYVAKNYASLDTHSIDREEIESIQLNPKNESQLLCSGPTFVQLLDYENDPGNVSDSDTGSHGGDSEDSDVSDDSNSDASNKKVRTARTSGPRINDANGGQREQVQKITTEHTEDYLNLF